MSLDSEKFKILVYSEIFPPAIGGSGNWLHDLYSRQSSEKYVFSVGDHTEAKEFDQKSKLKIIRFGYKDSIRTLMSVSGMAYFIRQIFLLLKLHRRYKFKEIHCARIVPEGVSALVVSKILKVSLVCYIHGEDIEISKFSREYRFLTQLVVSRANRLVCNSNNSKSILLNSWKCNTSKIRVLHPGVDTTLFRPSDDIVKLREKLGWSNRKIILTVSRLDERKGHDKLIEALPLILKKIPKSLYVIVGGGSKKQIDALHKKIEECGVEEHVHLTGKCDMKMMVECYQACDLFVLPNRQIAGNLEGFGIVLLEAQSCAKVVIAGDSGGTAETMEPNETGLIVDCTNSQNLVDPVVRLLQDEGLSSQMGRNGRQLMLNQFSWSKIVDQAAEAIEV